MGVPKNPKEPPSASIGTLSFSRQHWGWLAVALLLAIAVARIAATYQVFTQTIDETEHIAAGMEWMDRGTDSAYYPEVEHPPLSRISIALGLYLDGVRSAGNEDFWEEGNAILHSRNAYFRNLAIARAGILPFFILATLVVWSWSRSLFGTRAAFFSTLLFTTLPPVLAHAGLATTDLPLTAALAAALYAFDRWLDRPTQWRALVLGLAAALAVLSKFSALLFLPVCGATMLLLRYVTSHRAPRSAQPLAQREHYGSFFSGVAVGLLTLWAAYRFSIAASGLPAPALFAGIEYVFHHNEDGHLAYLFGEIKQDGWWYYFPVALGVKTPVPFLLLAAAGLVLLIGHTRRTGSPRALAPGLAAVAILLSVLPAHINIGLRHVLAMYPLLAIGAGYAASTLWEASRYRLPSRGLVGALIISQATSSVAAHPDYLAYFNLLAGERPDEILVDSDLDWGQDLDRLSKLLRELDVQDLSLCYFGSADITQHGLPRVRRLQPDAPVTGWVAISTFCYRMGNAIPPYTGYRWLGAYQPVRMAGRSIRLYYIPEKDAAASDDPPRAPTP